MSKLKNPLLSLSGKGALGKAISFVRRGHRSIAEKKPEVPDARTLAQLSWRHMYQKAVALWHALSAEEKQEWESLARPKHMTGFAWFVSQALKPNPGLYLPLQGGRMAGGIDMAKNWIRNVRKPLDDQEPVTLEYFKDNLPVGPYTQGCKVYHSVSQSIPDSLFAWLTFDSEDYDTDEMHDTVINNERITIKTPGIYLIVFHGHWNTNDFGSRSVYFRRNDSLILESRQMAEPEGRTTSNLTTICSLSVGEYLRVQAWQSSGAPLDMMRVANYTPYFSAQRIG
ncbi:unnamed protein product [marine sediment metagenome]|uniref:C1q domain-containing protein n=1 Tax=marine sediment metagenome TaxID=412755 RepID=X1RN43_9ZZZZ